MLITIQARHFDLSTSLDAYIEAKLKATLGKFKHKIAKINVSLFDVNGPKGGRDKCCKLIIKLEKLSPIVIQEIAEDMYDAINTSTHRAKRTIERQLNAARGKRKKFTYVEPKKHDNLDHTEEEYVYSQYSD